jgi:hypothetical protein
LTLTKPPANLRKPGQFAAPRPEQGGIHNETDIFVLFNYCHNILVDLQRYWGRPIADNKAAAFSTDHDGATE